MSRTFAHGTVYSSRDGVNVILPGTAWDGCGNHRYGPARGPVLDYVRKRIADAIAYEREIGREYDRRLATAYNTPPSQVTPGPDGRGVGSWAERNHTVSVFENGRGEYKFTVWAD